MNKKILMNIVITIGIVLILISIIAICTAQPVEGHKEYNEDELIVLIEDCKYIKTNANKMADSARALGWTDEDDLIQELKQKWRKADDEQKIYQEELDKLIAAAAQAEEKARQEAAAQAAAAEEAKWATKAAEYPAATQIWRFLKAQGYNDAVSAGILGNMMREVGGGTLNIQWWLYGQGFYGICQWNKGHGSVWGTDLNTQLNYLQKTIKYEIDVFGPVTYSKGMKYDQFLQITDPGTAAMVFSKAYERGASFTHSYAVNNSYIAYNYFTK